ncbi:MAG: radical SAM protein [Candidatus Omnitrophica bacterium]|nr:radical SAM protein [Candidatus Omnitrophota bacterium]
MVEILRNIVFNIKAMLCDNKPKKRNIQPIYLFEKINRLIAISTATGDFYHISPQTYNALKKWQAMITASKNFLNEDGLIVLAKNCNIPRNIIKNFPSPWKKHIIEKGQHAKSHLTDLTLNLTSECNLKCIYCWNDQGKYTNTCFAQDQSYQKENSTKNNNMPVKTALKAIDLLVKSCTEDKNLVLDFYGGEPLMNLKTLRAAVAYCRKNEQLWGVKFHFLLATNGTLLTPSLAEELIDQGVQIAVSIDGPASVHNKNRPFVDKTGSYEKITANLKNMPEKILKRLVGRTTVTPYYADMSELYHHLRNLGFERIELFESEDACHKINPQRESVFFHTREQYDNLCKEYEKLAFLYIDEVVNGKLDYAKTFFNRFFKLMQRLYYNYELTGGCPAAKGQIAVSSNGEIYPCTSFLGIKEFQIGNIESGIDKAAYKKFVNTINQRFNFCKNCFLFSLCRSTGSCLNMNHYFNGNAAKPHKQSCRLFQEKLKLAIAALSILTEKIPDKIEELFGFDPVGKRGNELY